MNSSAPSTPPRPARGLVCPRCGCGHFEVVYTRKALGKLLRRRACRYCGRRVTTSETVLA